MSRVAHLRNHPFIVYDEERVRVRAYYRSLSSSEPDPVRDWLAAEAEELEHQARERLVFPPSDLAFEDCYEPPIGFVVPIGGGLRPRYVGSRSPRRCIFCGAPDARFRNDAHLISESFGNRSLLTLEECDACNEHHGRDLEDDLAKMIIDARVLGRLKNKSRTIAKAKLGDGRGSIGGAASPAPLPVNVVEGDSSVTLRAAEGVGELGFPPIKFRPLSALRAIGRMAYLALPPDRRDSHQLLRDWVIGVRDLRPLKLWRFFYPTPFSTVGLTVWTRRTTERVPEVVAMFHCAHVVVLIAPTLDTDAITVLPPLLKPTPGATELQGHQITYENDKPLADPWIHTFVGADDYVIADLAACHVAVRIQLGDTRMDFDGTFSATSPDGPHELITHQVVGGTLPGSITLTSTTGGRNWRIEFNGTTPIALQIAALLANGATLTIVDDKGRELYPKPKGWFQPPQGAGET